MAKTKVVIQGCNGKLGELVALEVKKSKDIKVAAGIDVTGIKQLNFPVYEDLHKYTGRCDAIIDVSSPEGLSSILEYAQNKGTPLVIGTTGYSQEQREKIAQASERIPILMTSNFSIGANLLFKYIAIAVKDFKELGVNIEVDITEWHHTKKKDAPSGTAKTLKEIILSLLKDKKSVPIVSIREGEIVGNHLVKITAGNETLEFLHSVRSRSAFAEGAVNAARFIIGKNPGVYGMNNLIN